ncbi:SdrD B-like domain-containing protein [uncultured Thermanaerothrix sp.]|uniref:SdrD B-like domain-containing protein n=1 Tax=uncultured Thermanaerothrix sp. TaxID=1195149 RepID=UPI002606C7AC|nr:SdrD B-like domain-containing protein [uncultured Thermanaerothrix sp.]
MKKAHGASWLLACLMLVLTVSLIPATLTAVAATPTPSSSSLSYPLGPNLDQFPPGYNPLTGLPVSDPSWLELPAVLVSLSNFPPSVRPQTGLSFASQVYEIYITEGMTRFLAVFYGEPPQLLPTPPDLIPRAEPLSITSPVMGNRIWWDQNADGLQQPWEPGLGGIRIQLLDPRGNVLQSTSSDGNGFYAFSPPTGLQYRMQVHLPNDFALTQANAGDDSIDSDADPSIGQTGLINFTETNLTLDFGLIWNPPISVSDTNANSNLKGIEQPQNAGLAGVRSGREAYVPIVNAFPNGCLVAASKSADVNLRICRNVFGNNAQDINSAGLSLEQLRALAEANRNPQSPPNYSGNAFDLRPPSGGLPATQLNVFYAYLNQARWIYDPVAQAYWRYQDLSQENQVGKFIPATDRLTNRPLLFENIVILFVEHTARRPTIIDLSMGPGSRGRAIVFRNGRVYTDLVWSMVSEAYEKTTGLARPVRLRYPDGRPFPLAPGQTWFHVATLGSTLRQEASQPDIWRFRFYPPVGAR